MVKIDRILQYGNAKIMILKTAKDIGFLIKQIRKKQNLTQVQVAQLSNVGVRFLSDLENGKPTCEIDKTLKVLLNLGVRFEVDND